VPPSRDRPPVDANERASLLGWLDLQRSIVHWKAEGLSEDDAHRAVLPTSPKMTFAGVVSHLRWTEHCWFEVIFLDHLADENPQFGTVDDADFAVEGRKMADLLQEYADQCARSNEIIAEHPLEALGLNRDYKAGEASLRWMMHHMLEETARHLGHLDIMRELLDGTKGYY
jgi:hypothetical protein